MDDFIVLVKTKKEAKIAKEKIEKFINEELKLRLNRKSNYYPSKMGVDFCGFRIFETHKLLRKNSKIKILNNVDCMNSLFFDSKLDTKHANMSINSWIAHAKHCNSYKLRKKVMRKLEYIYDENRRWKRFLEEIIPL